MNVTQQDIDAQNGLLIVAIEPIDYTHKVKGQLEKYRKSAKIPGFRPGHTPLAVVEKRFGKAVLAEELNQLANTGIQQFIQDNGLELLGNPIPSENHAMEGDFEHPGTFKFTFEIGRASSFDYQVVLKSGVEYHTVRVDDKLINQQIEDIRRRYGNLGTVEEIGEKDLVIGTFQEITESGELLEGGIQHTTTLSLEFLPNPEAATPLFGKKPGDSIHLDPSTVSKDAEDTASLLGLSLEKLPETTQNFRFTVTEIKRMDLAELNAELLNKLFPDGEIMEIEGLKERVKKDLEGMFERDADRMLTRKVYDLLLRDVVIEFPESFLKRWIKLSASNPISDSDIDREFDDYLKSLKWQLIQSRIFKDNQIQLTFDDVMSYTKGLIVSNYAQYGIPAPEENVLESSARELLSKKEQANNIYDQLAEEKLTRFFKGNASLKMKPLSYDDFMEVMKK